MVCLEFEGELHECVGDVSGDFIGNGELVRLFCAGFARHGSTVDLGLGSEALAFDDDGIDVVQDAVEDGGRQGAVVVEDLRPVLVGAVGADQHRCALIALADDLQQQISTVLVDGKIPELVDDQRSRLQVAADLALKPAGRLRSGQGVDGVDGGGEENGVSGNAGGMAESQGDVRFTEADGTNKDDVGVGCDEGQTEQVLDLGSVDFFGPAPLKVFDGFEHGEARLFYAPLDGAVLAYRRLALDQLCQIGKVRELLVGSFGGEILIVAFDVGEVETIELHVQSREVTRGHGLPHRRY